MNNMELFERYLDADDWNYESGDGYARMGFTGESGTWKVFFSADDDGVIAVVSALEMFVPAARRLEVSVLFSWINFQLRVGGFQLDPRDGEVRFRIAYDVEGTTFTQEMFRNMLGFNLATMDRWFPVVMSVAYGNVAAEVAYRQATEESQAGL